MIYLDYTTFTFIEFIILLEITSDYPDSMFYSLVYVTYMKYKGFKAI